MAQPEIDSDQFPDEFKAQLDKYLEQYQTSGEGSLQEFLTEKSVEQEAQEDQKRREQEQQQQKSNQSIQQLVYSGSSYLKDLADQVGKNTSNDAKAAGDLRQKISQEGQPTYHYSGDKDVGTHDVEVSKKMPHTDPNQKGVFNSSTNTNDFTFKRSSPTDDKGQQFESNLSDNDKQSKVDQINRVEGKTFKDMADNHKKELDYQKTQENDQVKHQFKQKNGSEVTSDQHEGLKSEYKSTFNKNAKQDSQDSHDKYVKDQKLDARSHKSDISPKPGFVNTSLTMQPSAKYQKDLDDANVTKKAEESEKKQGSVSPSLTKK